jgi:hypothetical protein
MTLPSLRHLRGLARAIPLGVALALAGCAEPAPPAPPSLVALLEQPAERQLAEGLRLYQEGSYGPAQQSLQAALAAGLQNRADRAAAHKVLAFVACAYQRASDCEAHFLAAFDADPGFRLGASELGHPLWGPVYKRVAARRGVQGDPPPLPDPRDTR